jgi:hypothetical protein
MSVYPRNQPISNKTNRRTIDLVAGAFSSSALKARLSGEDLLLSRNWWWKLLSDNELEVE